jgi:type I restriction enzyme S subunit
MTAFVRVADLADQIRGVTYAKEDAISSPRPGYLPVLRAGNIADDGLVFDDFVFVPAERIAPTQKIRKDDVVIAASSGSLDVVGKAARALADFEGGFGAFCKVLRPRPGIDPAYFAHFFRTREYRQRVSALAAGANINNLRNEHLDEFRIPLPPLPEQRRIAAILDKADALRTKRRAALAQLDTLTQSIFLDMFGDPATNPKGWPTQSLDDLGAEFRYGTSNKAASAGRPTLRIPNVVGGCIDASMLKCVPVTEDEFERLRLRDGDLLFVRTNGNPAFVGRCAVFEQRAVANSGFAADEFMFASYLIRARVPADRADAEFLREYLLGSEGRRQLRGRCKTSAGQYNINVESLGAIPVPLPPIRLQRVFAERLRAVAAMRQAHKHALAQLDDLFASLQHRAFRGEL